MGLNFGWEIFLGFAGSYWFFFLVLIFAPIQSSLSLEIRSTPHPWIFGKFVHKFETRKHVGNVLPCLVLEMKSWKMNGPKATFKKS